MNGHVARDKGFIMRHFFKVAVMLIVSAGFSGCGKEVKMNNEISGNERRMEQFIEQHLDEDDFPGIQYVAMSGNTVLYKYAGGYADVKNQKEMTFENTLGVFSTTKVVTAVAILQLAESGKLDIDEKVSRYLPEIPYKEITIRQVLSHTAGVPNPILGNFFIHWEDEHASFDRNALLSDVLQKHDKLKFAPGKKIKYSNLGFAILGRVIEVVSGLAYEEYVQKNIFDKLNLNPKLCHLNSWGSTDSARPYYRANSMLYNLMVRSLKGVRVQKEGKWKSLDRSWYFNFPAHGGIVASAPEYVKIFTDLASGNSQLLSQKSLDLLFTKQKEYKKHQVALAWFIDELNGRRYYYHQGGGIGYVSEVRYYPDSNTVTLVELNATNHHNLQILNQLDEEVIENFR